MRRPQVLSHWSLSTLIPCLLGSLLAAAGPAAPLPVREVEGRDPPPTRARPAHRCGAMASLPLLPSREPASRVRRRGGPSPFTLIDGVAVLENDGAHAWRDRPLDLVGRTLSFVPGLDGYTLTNSDLAWDASPGMPVFVGGFSHATVVLDLPDFAFPFGGVSYTRLYLTTALEIAFERPPPFPGQHQLQATSHLLDRTPRLSPFQQGLNLYGWDCSAALSSDRVVITWTTGESAWPLQVQAVLHASGQVDFSYLEASRDHGSAVLITPESLDSLWAEESAFGLQADLVDDVVATAPHAASLEILSAVVTHVPDEEVVVVELRTSETRPSTDTWLIHELTLRDAVTGDLLLRHRSWWSRYWVAHRELELEDLGDRLRLLFLRSDLPDSVTRLDLELATGWQDPESQETHVADRVSFALDLPPARAPLMVDLSSSSGDVLSLPIVEAFTLPTLVEDRILDDFLMVHDVSIDALAVFQSFVTDIAFRADAYSSRSNPGVDGIGSGSLLDPITPAFIHANHVRSRFNDAGSPQSSGVLSHELAHRWLFDAHLAQPGLPSRVLNPQSSHPHAGVHLPAAASWVTTADSSCMGGSVWTDNGDGTFTSSPTASQYGFSWLDLYLMGLAAPAEVPDGFHLQAMTPPQRLAGWPDPDTTVSATRVDFGVDDLIAAEGPRAPSDADSPTDFFVPMVLVVRSGEDPTADAATVAGLCDDWERDFATMTADRGSVTCSGVDAIYHPPDGRIEEPAGELALFIGESATFRGEADDPDADEVTLRWDFDQAAPAAAGGGPHVVTFDEAGVFTVTLLARDATGRADPTPATVAVTVSCAPPAQVGELRVRREGSGLRFTWTDGAEPAPDEHVLFASSSPDFVSAVERDVSTGPGDPGLTILMPAVSRYYLIRARNRPNCLGP
ncbi:MAG: PKD domain-containing protein [Acidobacteriota bacterium]